MDDGRRRGRRGRRTRSGRGRGRDRRVGAGPGVPRGLVVAAGDGDRDHEGELTDATDPHSSIRLIDSRIFAWASSWAFVEAGLRRTDSAFVSAVSRSVSGVPLKLVSTSSSRSIAPFAKLSQAASSWRSSFIVDGPPLPFNSAA